MLGAMLGSLVALVSAKGETITIAQGVEMPVVNAGYVSCVMLGWCANVGVQLLVRVFFGGRLHV